MPLEVVSRVSRLPALRSRVARVAGIRLLASGSLLWLIGVGLAFAAQDAITAPASVDEGRVLFVIAAVVAVAGILLIERRAPQPAPAMSDVSHEPWRWSSRRRIVATAAIVVGFTASLAAIPLVGIASDRPALLVWLGAIVLVVAGAAIGARNPIRLPRPRREQLPEILLVLGVLGLALALRLPDLGGIPGFVHPDEGEIGIEGRRILDGGDFFSFRWFDVPSLSFAVASGTLWLFGNDLTGLRVASVIEGMLSILLLYLIVRRLFGRRPALLASFLLAVSQWDIHYSRQGSHYMQAQLATLLVLYFLLRAFDSRRALDYLLCGLSVGLCFEVYYAARLAPAIAGLVLLQRLFDDRGFLRREWPGLLALMLGIVVFLAPMARPLWAHPEAFNSRSRQVSLFVGANMRAQADSYHVDGKLGVIRLQTIRTVEAFNRTGDTSTHYGGRPLLDFWTAALLPLGFLLVLVRILSPGYFLLGSWIVLTLVFGTILTTNAPFSPRIVAVIPALVVLPALVVDAAWRGASVFGGRSAAVVFAIPAAAFFALALRANYHDYFDVYDKRPTVIDFDTALGHYISRQGHGYRYYLFGTAWRAVAFPPEYFLADGVDGVDVGPPGLPLLPVSPVPRGKGLVFVVERTAPSAASRARAIRRAYPGSRERQHVDRFGSPVFTSFAVSHRQAVRLARAR